MIAVGAPDIKLFISFLPLPEVVSIASIANFGTTIPSLLLGQPRRTDVSRRSSSPGISE